MNLFKHSFNSIKYKTLILMGCFTLVLSIIYFCVTVMTAYIVEDGLIENLLKVEAEYIEQQYFDTGKIIEPRLPQATIYRNKNDLPPFVLTVLARYPGAKEIFTKDENHFHLTRLTLNRSGEEKEGSAIMLVNVSRLLVVTNLSNNVILTYVLTGLLALFVAIIISLKIGFQAVSPVIELTKAIKKQRPEDTVSLPRFSHEMGYLSDTLEHSLNNLNSALTREQHFTRDVSHELRTPLTVISNTLTLASQRDVTKEDLHDITNATEQMKHIVEVLLNLARANSDDLSPSSTDLTNSSQCLSLKVALEEAILSCSSHNRAKDFHIDLNLTPVDTKVKVNKVLLDVLLCNLIGNAFSHSTATELDISLENGVLSFKNALKLDSVVTANEDFFKAGIKSQHSTGIGQGLYLTQRILESFNWRYKIKHTNNIFEFSIDLSDNAS